MEDGVVVEAGNFVEGVAVECDAVPTEGARVLGADVAPTGAGAPDAAGSAPPAGWLSAVHAASAVMAISKTSPDKGGRRAIRPPLSQWAYRLAK